MCTIADNSFGSMAIAVHCFAAQAVSHRLPRWQESFSIEWSHYECRVAPLNLVAPSSLPVLSLGNASLDFVGVFLFTTDGVYEFSSGMAASMTSLQSIIAADCAQ